MKVKPMTNLTELSEDEALSAVLVCIRRLFPAVSEHQARDLARVVIRDLSRGGLVLAMRQT